MFSQLLFFIDECYGVIINHLNLLPNLCVKPLALKDTPLLEILCTFTDSYIKFVAPQAQSAERSA
jgi:hypothetical protein